MVKNILLNEIKVKWSMNGERTSRAYHEQGKRESVSIGESGERKVERRQLSGLIGRFGQPGERREQNYHEIIDCVRME